ncbi:hypothetical protein [Nonomuraea aurantiaca]|uniref:hypothetical protein n=1 Tax=Nonomuraea aurantiaca TaxID=2878562 RepID=UPI001CDA0C10|nr:hypothetical protein [Nonomuraea aurantiaca]MCA2228739.1 hypothetical protein [Nonomuraea aurantiaca]
MKDHLFADQPPRDPLADEKTEQLPRSRSSQGVMPQVSACPIRQLHLEGAADAPAQLLVRIRSDRCFCAAPPPEAPARVGRPRRHGAKFTCGDATTWPPPSATWSVADPQYGSVLVQAWSGLHAKTQQHDGHGSRGPRPIVPGTVICLHQATFRPGTRSVTRTLQRWTSL